MENVRSSLKLRRTGCSLAATGVLSLAAATALLLLACGCRDTPSAQGTPTGAAPRVASAERSGRLKVTCTIGMITDGVKRVAGDLADVRGIMGEGVDPHLYKPSPGDVRMLSDADLIFYNGLHLEGKMTDLLVKLARGKPVVAVTEGIDPALLREPPEFEGNYDPHVWFDVSLWRAAVTRIGAALAEADAAHADAYRAGAAAYAKELDELHAFCKVQIAAIPAERRLLITAHDAFGYFGRAYGIEVMAIQGISTESEGSIAQINRLVDTIVTRQVPAVFFESSVNPKYLQSLIEGCQARGHKVAVGGELFSDAMGQAGTPEGTYVGMVRHNVTTIVGALAGSRTKGD